VPFPTNLSNLKSSSFASSFLAFLNSYDLSESYPCDDDADSTLTTIFDRVIILACTSSASSFSSSSSFASLLDTFFLRNSFILLSS